MASNPEYEDEQDRLNYEYNHIVATKQHRAQEQSMIVKEVICFGIIVITLILSVCIF